MKIPRIVKILLILSLLWILFTITKPSSKESISPVTGLSIASVSVDRNSVVVFIKTNSPVDPDMFTAKTSGPCTVVSAAHLPEQNLTKIVYRCPEGETLVVEGRGIRLVKRIA